MRNWPGALSLSFLAAILAIAALPATQGQAPTGHRSDYSAEETARMLDSDHQMLDQMRSAVSPVMDTMIHHDPMWIDPDMIRLQEEYEAQIDRMLGRRPGQP
jgi:hypothetical protein